MKFCAKCGKKGDTEEGLCSKCYKIVYPSKHKFKEIKINICKSCNRFFHRNRWSRYNTPQEGIIFITREKLKDKKADVSIEEESVLVKTEKGEKEFSLNINHVLCDKCGKSEDYFEGVLQLRDVNDPVIKYVMRDLEKKEKDSVFIQKIEEMKNGIDIYLTSQKYLQILGSKIKRRFKGTMSITRKLFTRNKQTSKHVYRVTVLYRQS